MDNQKLPCNLANINFHPMPPSSIAFFMASTVFSGAEAIAPL
ncbi:MAG: hypothetical protein ABGX28_03850 [Methylococcales bacterium]|jgi:hypothetical protein